MFCAFGLTRDIHESSIFLFYSAKVQNIFRYSKHPVEFLRLKMFSRLWKYLLSVYGMHFSRGAGSISLLCVLAYFSWRGRRRSPRLPARLSALPLRSRRRRSLVTSLGRTLLETLLRTNRTLSPGRFMGCFRKTHYALALTSFVCVCVCDILFNSIKNPGYKPVHLLFRLRRGGRRVMSRWQKMRRSNDHLHVLAPVF